MIILPEFASAAQPRVLQYDFEGAIGPEWSTPFSTKIGNNKVLGIFNDRNDKYLKGVQLTVSNIPPNAKVALSFDTYFIGSWDSEGDLADRWVLKAKGGPALLELTKFPATYREKDEEHPVRNVGFLKLGNRNPPYWIISEKVTAPFEQTNNGSITVDFEGTLTGRKTEFWALDNVQVEFQ
jgi:hypothetical protein